jgi:hypothetical protein
MHQQLWGYKVELKSVSRGTGGKKLNTTGLDYALSHSLHMAYPRLRPACTAEWKHGDSGDVDT